ncbi:MAG TPA: hypothetical protein VFX78_08630 [Candidatus Eisenbacteria bacterium]|nr:hypothetical protein [Candidatus Eisenbacteria bacterium]
MEAKVDVRKLQVLNDRINQTIDALNQVRLSVHGLGHTGVMPQMNPLAHLTQGFGTQGFGTQGMGGQGIGGQFGGQGFGQPGFGTQGFGGGFPQTPWAQGIGGLGHTSPFAQIDPLSQGNPFQQGNPLQQGNPFQQGNPLQQGNPFQQGNPLSQVNPQSYLTQGLQHSPYSQVNPYGNVPWPQSPYGAQGMQGIGRQGYVQDIVDQKLAEIRASDPYRISQTFPFAAM